MIPRVCIKKLEGESFPNFTGIDSRYEEPESAEIELKTGETSVEACVEQIMKYL